MLFHLAHRRFFRPGRFGSASWLLKKTIYNKQTRVPLTTKQTTNQQQTALLFLVFLTPTTNQQQNKPTTNQQTNNKTNNNQQQPCAWRPDTDSCQLSLVMRATWRNFTRLRRSPRGGPAWIHAVVAHVFSSFQLHLDLLHKHRTRNLSSVTVIRTMTMTITLAVQQ